MSSAGVSKLAFMVQDTERAKLLSEQRTVHRIERLFSVELCVQHVPYSAPRTPYGIWVTLHGTGESVARANDYISALCNPECYTELPCDCANSIIKLLFEPNSRLRDEIEREDCTSIQLSSSGTSLSISGNKLHVQSTERKLAGLMDTVRVHPEQSSLSHTREMFLEQECISRAAVERRIDPQRQQRVEYFVGLTFERSLVEEAFRSHPEMDDDDMLAVLMRRASSTSQRLRPISIPRQRADPIASSPSSSSSGGAAGGGSGGSSSSHHDPAMLRPVVIDGSNVAMRHGNGKIFSCRGILLAVNWFLNRGHMEVRVFVPAWRKEASKPETPITDQEILYQLESRELLTFTPSRWVSDKVHGRRHIICYDDRFVVRLAEKNDGVIVSNDQYRDLMQESKEWKELIETRLLQFAFVNDIFMPPDDPLGRSGPSLDAFLQKDSRTDKHAPLERPGVKPCPYADRCTFGTKCKFYHPEREQRETPVLVSPPVSSSRNTSRSATPSPSPDKKLHSSCRSSQEDVRLLSQQSNEAAARLQPGIDLQELSDRMRMTDLQSNRHPSPQKKISESYGSDPACYYNAHGKPPPQFLDLTSAEQFVQPGVLHPSPIPLPLPQESAASTPSGGGGGGRYRNVTFPLLSLPQHSTTETRHKVRTEEIMRYIPPAADSPVPYNMISRDAPHSGASTSSPMTAPPPPPPAHRSSVDHQTSGSVGLVERDPSRHPFNMAHHSDRYQMDSYHPSVSENHGSFTQQQQQRSIQTPPHLYPPPNQLHLGSRGYELPHHQNMSSRFLPPPPPPPTSTTPQQQHRAQHQNMVQQQQFRSQTPSSQEHLYHHHHHHTSFPPPPPPPSHPHESQDLIYRGAAVSTNNYPANGISYDRRCAQEQQTNGYHRSFNPQTSSHHHSVSPPPVSYHHTPPPPTSTYHSSTPSSSSHHHQAQWLPRVNEERVCGGGSEALQSLYRKAKAVLPHCEERIQWVMTKWPQYNLEQIVDAVRSTT